MPAYLEEMRAQISRQPSASWPGGRTLRTHEGVGAVDEAIRFLRRTRPLAPLTFPPESRMAAAEHVADQASGAFGHTGSDRSNPGERMNRHGTWSGRLGRKYFLRQIDTPRDIVLALIIDDGQRARKHRKKFSIRPSTAPAQRWGRMRVTAPFAASISPAATSKRARLAFARRAQLGRGCLPRSPTSRVHKLAPLR